MIISEACDGGRDDEMWSNLTFSPSFKFWNLRTNSFKIVDAFWSFPAISMILNTNIKELSSMSVG